MSFAEIPTNIIKPACEAAIAQIERGRAKRRAANAATNWWRVKPWSELSIDLYCARQEYECLNLIRLCNLAEKSGVRAIKVSADVVADFDSFVEPAAKQAEAQS